MENSGKHPQSQKAPWLDPQSLRSVNFQNLVHNHLFQVEEEEEEEEEDDLEEMQSRLQALRS